MTVKRWSTLMGGSGPNFTVSRHDPGLSYVGPSLVSCLLLHVLQLVPGNLLWLLVGIGPGGLPDRGWGVLW
jgi:hypothetical protein